MCVDLKLMNSPKPVTKPTPVYLPDGTIKFLNHIGNILLNSKLTLHDTLHVPSFKFNLLLVPKLTVNANLKFTFYPKHFVLQDLQNEEILAVGKLVGNLYILDKNSLHFRNFSTCNKTETQAI